MMNQLRNVWSAVLMPALNNLQKPHCFSNQLKGTNFRCLSLFYNPSTQPLYQTFSPVSGSKPSSSKPLVAPASNVIQCIRSKNTGKREYYKGSAWKRYNKNNIERRLSTTGGLAMLWRKTLKGRHQLAAYERILPNTVGGKILPDHHFKYNAHPLTRNRLPKPGLF
ncbi:uncharacterized protein LOC131940688 [Physella acuta]|uniref:uncharacterized protein LOC131940688 n=1 Tax=Physella acuta TaxID=109671 RepID=UPI0027DCC268|nr:uncharacterized protein LOC131940688 [Physella acuta]